MGVDRRAFVGSALAFTLAGGGLARAAEDTSVFQAYERDTGGKVFAYAQNTATGATLAWRPDERVVMCSTFKASAAAFTLRRVDLGQEKLDRMVPFTRADLLEYAPVARAALAKGVTTLPVSELCRGAVEISDNTCANLLLAAFGGPAALTAFWREIGDTTSRLDHNEPVLNRSPPGDPHDTTTAHAMADTLRRYMLGRVLTDASRDRLKGWMIACTTGRNRLRAGLPPAWTVGDKTGNNGKDATGDIAVAWPTADRPVLMAVYTQGGAPTPAQLEAVFTQIGRMVGQRLA